MGGLVNSLTMILRTHRLADVAITVEMKVRPEVTTPLQEAERLIPALSRAELYANENFPRPVADELRRLGHDVVSVPRLIKWLA